MDELGLRHLAYLGDAVWELFVREHTILKTPNAGILHKITTDKVKAGFQAQLLDELTSVLTDEEKEIARRARNLPIPVARRSNQVEYRHATAFEALVGQWYYYDKNRLDEVLQILKNHIQ